MKVLEKSKCLKALDELDLARVKAKLMSAQPEGKDWTQEFADTAEKWYKRFLALIIEFPNERHAPNQLIDEIWHQHIVDTKNYVVDCQRIFGRFIHHNPYFGLNGDALERDDTFELTMKRLEERHGESIRRYGPQALECASDCGWVCGGSMQQEEEGAEPIPAEDVDVVYV
jgi:hypothetical protein